MKGKAPIGKKNFTGKKFKSAGENELSASDKNAIKKNIDRYTIQQLAIRIGKPIKIIEKFIKKENLISIIEIREVKEWNEASKPTTVLSAQTNQSTPTKSSKEKERKRSAKVAVKISFIKENYQKLNVIEIAKELNTAITGIRYHFKKLNLLPLKAIRPQNTIITRNETFIKENHRKYTVIELSAKLNCTTHSVRYYLRKLKLKALRVTKSQEISPKTIHFLKVNYHTMTAREMSNALGNLSWSQVRYLCEKHGFLRTPEEITAIRNRWGKVEFTPSEEQYIIANHGVISLTEIANNIQRTRSSVINFLARKSKKITKEQHNILNRKNFEKARMKQKVKADKPVL